MPHVLVITVAVGSWLNRANGWGQGETEPNGTTQPKAVKKIDQEALYSEWRSEWEPRVDRTRWIPKGLASEIIQRSPPRKNGEDTAIPLLDRSSFEKALQAEFAIDNKKFAAAQKEKLGAFFSSVERNPLTQEQMESCICMDDAVQIVAAAGSGKTSTMVARIGYALAEKLYQPEQILVLAFNRSVAEELQSRIKERLSGIVNAEQVKVKTFNAFGLEVIGKSVSRKPKLADWVEPGRDVRAITEIVDDLGQSDPQFRLDWDMFRVVFGRDLGAWDAGLEPDLERRGNKSILTANGDFVKSDEERMICDFLFFNGVEYDYERSYEHDTVTAEHSQYHPDFFYPRIGLYHEHFALDAHGNAPAHFTGDYVAGVHWKRQLHAENQTLLFETTSHNIRNGSGFLKLKEELERRGAQFNFDADRVTKGQEPIPTKQLASTIRAFQQHVKSNGLSHRDLHNAVANAERGHRDRLTRFVSLFERISDEWQRRLKIAECVDFDDMLLMAIEHIESGRFKSPYMMILADEFQDVSQAKLRLLKALKQNAGFSANVWVVGDDWQGINRFAGADISVMTNFENSFRHSTQLNLSKTFRCPQNLCDASSDFIQKNPKQIQKDVTTTNPYAKKPLHAFAAETAESASDQLEDDLRSLHGFARSGKLNMPEFAKVTVMLLGRYHKDKPAKLGQWQNEFRDHLDLRFETAHASKGLEADYVMLLNVTKGILGFPSQIVDDPVLQLAMPQPDEFPFAEERRLFYVALTRARRQTRIYSLRERPSDFLLELSKGGHLTIETDEGDLAVCPKCGNGVLKQIAGDFGTFVACSTYPRCDFKKNVLSGTTSKINRSQPIRVAKPMAPGTTCPTCEKGVMVERTGKTTGSFLGCSLYPWCKTTAPKSN